MKLVLGSGAAYNMQMDGVRLIHVLLVALMCHGQLAANTHVIDHFHEIVGAERAFHPECDAVSDDKIVTLPNILKFDGRRGRSNGNHSRFAFNVDAFGNESPYSNGGAYSNGSAYSKASGHTHDENKAEANCAIFHAVLNLTAIFNATQYTSTVRLQHGHIQLLQSRTITLAGAESHRIRAPPTHS